MLLTATPALAEKPRITVLPFGHAELERQLRGALCSELTCVPPGAVTVKGRIDWREVSDEQLTGVVKAKVVRDPTTRRRILDVQVFATARVILVRKRVPLTGSALSAPTLRALQGDLVGVIQRAHGPGEEPAPASPPAVAPPRAPPTAAVPPPPALPPTPSIEAAPLVAAPKTPAEPAPATADARPDLGAEGVQAERGPPLLEIQPTVGLLHREFGVSSSAGAAPNLRSTTVPTTAQPGLYLAFYPLRAPSGFFSSLGLEGTVSASVGLQVSRANDPAGTLFPATAFGASLAVRLKLRLGQAVTLGPVVGWQLYNFDVHPTSGGEVLTGQPAVHWRALAPGLKLDVALGRWLLFLEARYLYIYSVGPLQSSGGLASFTAAPSFDGVLGFGVQLTAEVQLRLGFAYARYAIEVPAGASATQVTGVSDQLLGGSLSLRYSL